MHIRGATQGDVDAIRGLVAAAYGKYVARIGREPGPMLDDYRARVDAGTTFVADCDGEIGGLLVLVAEPDALQVDNVAVSPARQGEGIGRALLGFAEAEARRRSLRRLTLYTNEKMTENLAMYPALGWRETGRRVQDGYARVFFEKSV
jgi:GNAT superfamily N-acetyltransferase